MVKKILLDGTDCNKCVQAEKILREKGYFETIDEVIYAREGDPESDGMKLAKKHDIDLAPFFLVNDEKGERLYTRVFEFIKKELDPQKEKGTSLSSPFEFDAAAAASRYKSMSPQDILGEAQSYFGSALAIAFSGAEDVVLIDMASKNAAPFRVFCLDTGRLHSETYKFFDTVREHYGIEIEPYYPNHSALETFLKEKGFNSFYRDGHTECCRIRKVEPLSRALKGASAWATGLRRSQNPSSRADLAHAEADTDHLNQNSAPLIKFNPLLDWDTEQVWAYIREHNVPYNELHDRGYMSIGCEPCTRPTRPGEHERMGRWWWEESTLKECGLHVKGTS